MPADCLCPYHPHSCYGHPETCGCAVPLERFTLVCERREDGGLRVSSPDVLGLILSHRDPHAVMADVLPAISALVRHNGKR
jgi:hypothetical protein